MDCVSCDTEAEFNHVAVDRSNGEILGTICTRCEDGVVSRVDDARGSTMASCLNCGDSADVLFPKWDSIVETDDAPDTIEYTIELTTPALCDGCLSAARHTPRVRPPNRAETD